MDALDQPPGMMVRPQEIGDDEDCGEVWTTNCERRRREREGRMILILYERFTEQHIALG